MHNFLSEAFLSATWCGTFACSTKQGPNELKNRRTKVTDILHVVHFRPTGIRNDDLQILKRLWSAECVCSVGSPATSAFGFAKVAGKPKRN